MKTKKILFALFAMVCVMAASVSLTACGGDDDDETNVEYNLGFSSMKSSDLSEIADIDNTFKSAIGVSTDTFTYPAGEEKLKAACEQAAAQLANKAFSGEYTYLVRKFSSKGVSDFYKWSNK